MLPVISSALEVANEMVDDGSDDPVRYKSRMIERVLTRCGENVDQDSFDYFMTQIVGNKAA